VPAALHLKVKFGGETYTNVSIAENVVKRWRHENLIGLQFFARNLVTFDFPKRIMYLKPESVGAHVNVGWTVPPNTSLEPTATAP
jgi:hypothetical protein